MRQTMNRGRGTRGWGAGRLAAAVLVPLVFLLVPHSSRAQSVVDVLRQQRAAARIAEIQAELGSHVAPRPPARLGEADVHTRALLAERARRQAARDSLVRADAAAADSVIRAAQLATARWRKVEPGAQQSFVEQYREAYWQAAAMGAGTVAIDTVATPALRGRLQAVFGDPTRNADAQERHGYGGSEFVQFEYWFVVNDSIPVLALDVDGPFGRGLLVAGMESQSGLLPTLKADLSRRLLAAPGPDPFVDYYHAYDRRRWYRTGFNGAERFTVEVRPPRWSRRPTTDRWIIHR